MWWTTLNTDGSAMGNPRKAGYGGLLRNCEGNGLGGFARGVGPITTYVAELWAFRDGLNLAFSLGIESLIVELDALAIVHLLRNFAANFALEPLLSNYRNLLRTFLKTQIEHVSRPKSMEHEFRCMTNLLNLYNSINIINPK